jgi:hypothetical protein
VIFAVAYIVVEIGLKTPTNLISLGGMAALVTFTFICSYNPAAVNITLIGSFLLLFNVKLPEGGAISVHIPLFRQCYGSMI